MFLLATIILRFWDFILGSLGSEKSMSLSELPGIVFSSFFESVKVVEENEAEKSDSLVYFVREIQILQTDQL